MKKIYKYELPPFPGVVITIKEKIIKPLKVQKQYGKPTLWAIVDVDDLDNPVDIVAFGTGWELPEDMVDNYLGSIQDTEGYVWHYFAVSHYMDGKASITANNMEGLI